MERKSRRAHGWVWVGEEVWRPRPAMPTHLPDVMRAQRIRRHERRARLRARRWQAALERSRLSLPWT